MADEFDNDVKVVLEQLDTLDREMPRILPEATLAGAKVLLEEAQANAPRRRGKLAESGHIEDGDRTATSAASIVRFDAFYAKFEEFGIKARSISPKKGVAFKFGGGQFARGSIPAPGTTPFLIPSARSKRSAIQEQIRQAIDRVVQTKVISLKSRMR